MARLVDDLNEVLFAVVEGKIDILEPRLKEVNVPELFRYQVNIRFKDKAIKVLKDMGSDVLFAETIGDMVYIYFYNKEFINIRRSGDIDSLRQISKDINNKVGDMKAMFGKVIRLDRNTQKLLSDNGIEVIE